MARLLPRRSPLLAALLGALVALGGCAAPASLPADADGSAATFTILQLNDVYEISPIEGGRAGGLARVATIRNRLLAENPRTLTMIAGDFFSPSALGTARVDGERLAGKQMVAVLNQLGLDVAAIGNHEFDLNEAAFRARLAESAFPYVSANVAPAAGAAPFPGVVPGVVFPLAIAPGDTLRVGVTSAVLPSNPKPYVVYTDALDALAAEAARLDGRADVVVGLTHLAMADDVRAAATIPALDLVLGGHEHENIRAYRGPNLTPILKADANARTVYVHRVTVDRATRRVDVASELVFVGADIPDDPATAAEVARWIEMGYAGFRADGFEPERVVATTTEDLDGREGTVRTRPAPLGALIAESFRRAAGTEAAVFNGGSIRIDDVIPPGTFTEYDAIRVLPFGGEVLSVRLPGALLGRVLEQGLANAGTGGFLQTAGIGRTDDGRWTVGGAALVDTQTYTVATNDFLVTGLETGLDYFKLDANPDLALAGRHGDVRRAMITELQRVYGR
jgi:5'-nucleotidase